LGQKDNEDKGGQDFVQSNLGWRKGQKKKKEKLRWKSLAWTKPWKLDVEKKGN